MISLLVGYISWAQASVGSDGNRVSQPGAGICTYGDHRDGPSCPNRTKDRHRRSANLLNWSI